MDHDILNYLSRYIPVGPELEEEIRSIPFLRSFPKGTLLLKEGGYSNECYFIIKGCIRCFYIKEGEERTTEFYTEEEVVTPSAYGTGVPSGYYIECLEDTLVGLGSPELESKIYQKFPQLESLNRALAEAALARQRDAFAEFKMAGPEERYLHLLQNRPDLLQRVPQYQLASYLGITPESLSRIRKRTRKKEIRN